MKRLLALGVLVVFLANLFGVALPVYAQEPIANTIEYSKDTKTDVAKLFAVYSLLEQMRLEHNRVGAIAKANWPASIDKWQEYTRIFREKQQPLLLEQMRLKQSILKASGYTFDDIKGTSPYYETVIDDLYGNKELLKSYPTLARAPPLEQLKAVDFSKLEGKWVDPLEDWTTYNETDSNNKLTVTANHIEITEIKRGDDSVVFKDFGVNHFDTSWNHTISAIIDSATQAYADQLYVWATTNTTTAPTDATDPMIFYWGQFDGTNVDWFFTIDEGANENEDSTLNRALGERQYLTIVRTVSNNILYFYDDSLRTNLVDTLTINASNGGYRYMCNAFPRGGASSGNLTGDVYDLDLQEGAGVSAPTVVTNAATNIESTTVTISGNITATGGENCTDIVLEYGTSSGNYTDNWTDSGDFEVEQFSTNLTSLSTGTTYYYRAGANNSAGWGYGSELTFLTKPATPTNVSASDGSSTDNVSITWDSVVGSDNYTVYRDGSSIGVTSATNMTDTGADAPTITAGSVVATDGSSSSNVSLSLSGTSTNNGTAHSYTVQAHNATGDSDNSSADLGNRGVGALAYQWQRSAADSDASYSNIAGATSSTYVDSAAPAPTITAGNATASDATSSSHVTLSANETATAGDGRYWQCVLSASGASNQTASANRGNRGTTTLTYQWYRSSGDSAANFSSIAGGTTDPYNDTGGATDPDGRYYLVEVSMVGATSANSTSDRGNMSATPTVLNPPTNFTLTDLGAQTVGANWTNDPSATATIVRYRRDRYPTSATDGESAYNGTAESVNISGLSLDISTWYFSAWSYDGSNYSSTYATGSIGGTRMVFFGLIALVGILTTVAVKSSYYILKFFAGVAFWALGVWLAYNPLMSGANPVNDIMITLCVFGGFAMMFMMGWRTSTRDGKEVGEFNIRVPRVFGGRSEEEEFEERRLNARTSRERREMHRERLNNAIRGRR